jgi:hypothetical protein
VKLNAHKFPQTNEEKAIKLWTQIASHFPNLPNPKLIPRLLLKYLLYDNQAQEDMNKERREKIKHLLNFLNIILVCSSIAKHETKQVEKTHKEFLNMKKILW